MIQEFKDWSLNNMALVITKRMQSLIDCIDAEYNEADNTYTKLQIVAGSYSDTYKSINGIRPRHSCMNSWSYEDYIYHLDKLADEIVEMERYEQEQKELKKKRISNALKNTFSNSPFANFYEGANNG